MKKKEIRVNGFSLQKKDKAMHSIFPIFFQLGVQHIADVQAYDHIVFLMALCATYPISAWRKIAILVTAFTIGHCITLI